VADPFQVLALGHLGFSSYGWFVGSSPRPWFRCPCFTQAPDFAMGSCVGVGHDDDLLVAQILVAIVGAGAAAERRTRSESCWFWASLSLPALATLRILPRSGMIAWLARLRACLADPPAESPSTMKISEPSAAVSVQSDSLPGRRDLRPADLRAPFPGGGGCARRRAPPPSRAAGSPEQGCRRASGRTGP
jgi:hypothetical protein